MRRTGLLDACTQDKKAFLTPKTLRIFSKNIFFNRRLLKENF
jgi:hypothetical protein